MVAKVTTPGRNIVDFGNYQRGKRATTAVALQARSCRHCGAALEDDEVEDDCSSAVFACDAPLRLRVPR
jgi:predicted nuclease with RNAse H fold